MTLSLGLVCFDEHVFGRIMLDVFLSAGLSPRVVVLETSPVGRKRVGVYEELTPPEKMPKSFSEILQAYPNDPCQLVYVENMNGVDAMEALKDLDFIVLAGARIMKEHMIRLPRYGMLNVHPGILPRMKGSMPTIWSIYYDFPQGLTVHWVDPGLDTGNILLRREVPVYQGDRFGDIFSRVNRASGEAVRDVLLDIAANGISTGQSQEELIVDGEEMWCNTWPSEEVIARALEKLREQTYEHTLPNCEETRSQE